MTCLPDESNIRIPYKMTTNEILQDMFTQFSEISSRFNHADRAKCVKCLLFTPQYIEHKISIFNETTNQMKERKTIIYNLREVAYSFKNGLNTMFLPIFCLLGVYWTLTNVKYVKNEVFGNYFEQFSHFSTV